MNFACASCGAQFLWSPDRAGKRGKCKCGTVLDIPTKPPQPEPRSQPDPDPHPNPDPAASGFAMDVVEPLDIAPPIARKAPPARPAAAKVLDYKAAPKKDADFETQLKNFKAPLILLVAGFFAHLGASYWLTRDLFNKPGLDHILGFVAAAIAVNAALITVGVIAAARSKQIELKPYSYAFLKLASISAASMAANEVALVPLRFIPMCIGPLLAWLIGFSVYFALLGFLFDLDQEDTWYLVKVIFLMRIILFFALWKINTLMS